MDASILESLFLATVVLAGLGFLAIATAGFVLWRMASRKLRALRSHGAVIGATAVWEAAASNRWNRTATPATSADLAQWSGTRVRKEMWISVDRASAAVRAADEVGGPTAELGSLCRRLNWAATDIDKVLRVDPAAKIGGALYDQVAELIRVADDVQQAAVASAGDAGSQRIRDLTEDAEQELALLDAGLASIRAPGHPQLPR